MEDIQPTMGRVVKYLHPGSADGKYLPTESPAIIQKVYQITEDDGIKAQTVVDLFVMSNTGGIFFPKACVRGKNWDWLDYTKAQATK